MAYLESSMQLSTALVPADISECHLSVVFNLTCTLGESLGKFWVSMPGLIFTCYIRIIASGTDK